MNWNIEMSFWLGGALISLVLFIWLMFHKKIRCSICGTKKPFFKKWINGIYWDGFNDQGFNAFCSDRCEIKWLRDHGVVK